MSLPWLPSFLRSRRAGMVLSVASLIALTAVLAPFLAGAYPLNVALLFFLVVLVASTLWGFAVGLLSALVAALMLNYFFVLPLHTLAVATNESVTALLLFFAVALVGAGMLSLLRKEVASAQTRATEVHLLLELNQALAAAPSPSGALEALCAVTARALHATACGILIDDGSGWAVLASAGREGATHLAALGEGDRRSATAAVAGDEPVSAARDPSGADLFVPFPRGSHYRGVLHITGTSARTGVVEHGLVAALAAEASVSVERSRLAREAQEAEVLRRADALKGVLLSSMSHDLSTPLTAIKAAVGNLRDPEIVWTDADTRGFLRAIEDESDRLAATVDDLLQMSRLEEGMVQPLIEPVQVSLLLRDALQAAKPGLAGRHACVSSDDSLWIAVDYGLFMRALGNLIENSIRYSQPDGCISLMASMHDDHVRIVVRDNGPGIGPDESPHVFEKFYRGTAARSAPGTGLGLSIVKTIVELCGGQIAVLPGSNGAKFAIDLPSVRSQG